jgi:hypothetical protein
MMAAIGQLRSLAALEYSPSAAGNLGTTAAGRLMVRVFVFTMTVRGPIYFADLLLLGQYRELTGSSS